MAASVQVVGDNSPEKRALAVEVTRAIHLFLSPGVGRVERSCNEKRQLLMAQLSQLPHDRHLVDRGLPNTTVEQALEELGPAFQLVEPQKIIVNLAHDKYPGNPHTAMAADPGNGIMYVFANAIDVDNLRDLYGHMPIADITFHEMFHLCQETQYDGVIRYNWAGVDAVKNLLGI